MEKVRGVGFSATLQATDTASTLRRQGVDVINFAHGRPQFDTPENIKNAAKQALDEGYTSYTHVAGLFDLREAISHKLQVENNLEVDPKSEILVTVGTKQGIFTAIMSTIQPGEQVLVSDPAWVSYVPGIRFAGGKPVPVPLHEEEGFSIDASDFEANVTSKTKMLIINTPQNPTGHVMTKQEIEAIADLAVKYDLLVLSDEIYEKIIFDRKSHLSISSLPHMKERTITVNGFSKGYAMAGWRIGYVVAPKRIIQRMLVVHEHIVTCPSSFAQKGAIEALIGTQTPINQMVLEYEKRRKVMLSEINQIEGVYCNQPDGAVFVFPNFSKIEDNSKNLCKFLIEDARVFCSPGSAFGSNSGEGHLRINYAEPIETIKEGVERIKSSLEKLRT